MAARKFILRLNLVERVYLRDAVHKEIVEWRQLAAEAHEGGLDSKGLESIGDIYAKLYDRLITKQK